MSGPRVFDGRSWTEVQEGLKEQKGVVPPAKDGDGTIFVAIPSFRDGVRCAKTLNSLFENAKDPSKVFVGLIEQNAPEDKYCLEKFCEFQGVSKHYTRKTIRKDVTKLIAEPERKECPHFDQIRLLAFHNLEAKGPLFARAMTRKVLGNEEYCLQVDAHTSFSKNWDEMAKEEWKMANNEFAVISSVPASQVEQQELEGGGSKVNTVPRQCAMPFGENGVPNYVSPADGQAVDLQKPLLANTWSSAFSFSKCHLEESAPYDSFAPYIMGAEQFSRFARFWTRGYDVYTPTRNIAFHDYDPQAEGHNIEEWMKRRRVRVKDRSLRRLKTILHLPGGETSETERANMGIYGLGKRRTLEQLTEFVDIDLVSGRAGNRVDNCVNLRMIPYNPKVSPVENMYDNPNDLDAQPEYPLRTNFVFYEQEEAEVKRLDLEILDQGQPFTMKPEIATTDSRLPSASTMFFLWILGLVIWCIYVVQASSPARSAKPRAKATYKSV